MLGALRRSNDNLYRYGYYAAMYSGLRAAYNRLRSRRAIPNQRLQRLHSSCVIVGRSALFDARVYARRQPADGGPRADHGVISLRLRRPPMPRWLYRIICATSHFGDGHVEVAFYWRGNAVTVYAVRNIAAGNVHRLGLAAAAARLRITSARESLSVLRGVADALKAIGLQVGHAIPEECIALSVDDRLLAAGDRERAVTHWRRHYRRLHQQFAAPAGS